VIPGIGFESQHKFIPAHQQVLALAELAQNRGVHPDKLLRGTGIFYEDICSAQLLINPKQMLLVYKNAERLIEGKEVAFLYGQYLLPGHQALFSSAMMAASNTQDALTLLENFGQLALPLMQTRLRYDDRDCFVQFLPASGDDYQSRFLIETVVAALISVCRLLGGSTLGWRFLFAYPTPDYPEQYQVHLGDHITFDAHINGVFIPREHLSALWPRGATANFDMACSACQQALPPLAQQSLAQQVYQMLLVQIQQPPGLELVAQMLELSPASLKRKLKDWGCSYQQLLDAARRHMAIYYIRTQGMSSEQLAFKLNYHDKHNFKRSFKRWTGLTPAAYTSLSPA